MNPRKEKCEFANRNDRRSTYPCGSWAGVSLQLLPLYPTFLSTFLSHPVSAPSYQCVVCESPTRSPDFCQEKGPLVKQPQESRPRGEQMCSFSFLYIHPDSLFMQAQRSAPAPDSIPTAIFHWEHDCYPLADWRRLCPRGGTDLRTAPRRLLGGENQWRRNVMLSDKLINMRPWQASF